MAVALQTDGVSAIWPQISDAFLSMGGIPESIAPDHELQSLYRELLQRFDAATSCEMKEIYKFKLFLNKMQRHTPLPPELALVHKAFVAWVNFEYQQARDLFSQHLRAYPTDIVALFFTHMLDFCTGKTQHLTSELSLCGPHIPRTHSLYPYFLAIKAFVLCESQRAQEAFDVGLESIRVKPHNAYGLHATAHALHEMGRWKQLSGFLADRKADWIDNQGMRMHIYWHLAIAYERCGESEKALQAFKALYALKSSPFAKQDLDAVGFLWRLRLKASDTQFADIWKRLALLWTGSIYESTSYLHKIHAALAFSATGQTLLIEKQIAESDGFGIEPQTHRTGLRVLEAIRLLTLGRHPESLELLHLSRPHWPSLGGSRAQREILDLTLDYAALQANPTLVPSP